jgi:gas vesicle protein
MTQEEKSNGAGLTLLTFILGAASGAAVALLYAPQSGKDTREYLAERARQGRDQAANAANKAKDYVDQGRQTVNNAVEQGRQTVEQGKQTFNSAIDQGKQAIEQGKQAIEQGKQTLNSAIEQGRNAYQQVKRDSL